jgi:hypothetical protein
VIARAPGNVPARGIYAVPSVTPDIVWLTIAGIVCFFLFSGMFLDAHGWPYTLAGSPLPLKIHPGSYFIFAALLLTLLRENPVFFLYRLAVTLPAHFIYLTTIVGLIVYMLLRFGTNGASFMVDLYLVPVFVAILLARLRTEFLARLFLAAILYLTLNSVIGIVEYATHSRLTPYLVDGKPVVEQYFRATATFGHPLQNALMTAVGLLVLPALRGRRILMLSCALVMAVSLFAFGGRSALVVVLIFTAILTPFWAMRAIVQRAYSYQELVGTTMAGLILVGLAIEALAIFGGSTRIFSSLHWDESANTRIIGLRVFDMVSPIDVVFGIGQQGILERTQLLASYYGIIGLENSWLLLLLIFGAVGLAFFLVALLAWLREILKGAPAAAYLSALGYFAIASTNNTLAAKDCSLVQLTILLYGARAYAAWISRSGRARKGL